MNKTLVFNHHSLPFDSRENADSAIVEFIKTCLAIQNFCRLLILVDLEIDCNWFRVKLSENYYWQDWYNQNKNDVTKKDLIRAFRSIVTRQPFYSSEDIKLGADLYNVYLNDGSGPLVALEAAAWHEVPILSFPTRIPWTQSLIHAFLESIDENAEFKRSEIEIINLCSVEVSNKIKRFLIKKLNEAIQSGKDLLQNSEILFPSLILCGNSIEQLQNWSGNTTIIDQVRESLVALNNFAEDFKKRRIKKYTHKELISYGMNHNVSGESDSVKNDRRLRKTREFYLPNGKKEFFENHIKLSRGYRIHFFVDHQNYLINIGYIGPHLPLS